MPLLDSWLCGSVSQIQGSISVGNNESVAISTKCASPSLNPVIVCFHDTCYQEIQHSTALRCRSSLSTVQYTAAIILAGNNYVQYSAIV